MIIPEMSRADRTLVLSPNLIGNPLDTTIAALPDLAACWRDPKLNFICIMAAASSDQGRPLVHGLEVRPEPKVHVKHSPRRISTASSTTPFARPSALDFHFLDRRNRVSS